MKKILLILLLTTGFYSFGQQYQLNFNYDAAGNQVLRDFEIVVDGRPDSVYQKKAQAYPSPMENKLNIAWQIEEEDVALIQVKTYDMRGSLIHNVKPQDYENEISLSFERHSQGVYIVKLYYNDDSEETIKVLKN